MGGWLSSLVGGVRFIFWRLPQPCAGWWWTLCQEIKFIHVLYLIMIWMIWWGGSYWRYSDRCWASIFSMTLVQMVVQIWLILISFSTNLHYRALCAIFIWESNSSGVVKMLLHSSHMDLELKMVSKSVLWLPSNTKDTFEETYKSVHEGIEYPCTYVNVKQKKGLYSKTFTNGTWRY